jgi:hypothetical protein
MLGVHNLYGNGPLNRRAGFFRARKLSSLVQITAFLLGAALATAVAVPGDEPTVDELKARVSSANLPEKAKLCVQIAEKQLTESNKLYASDEVVEAQSALGDVIAFTELARDYSIQSHKHEKQIEISVRAMTRRLNDLLHTLGHEEQTPVRDALKRLEHVRDDLLGSMFPKGSK